MNKVAIFLFLAAAFVGRVYAQEDGGGDGGGGDGGGGDITGDTGGGDPGGADTNGGATDPEATQSAYVPQTAADADGVAQSALDLTGGAPENPGDGDSQAVAQGLNSSSPSSSGEADSQAVAQGLVTTSSEDAQSNPTEDSTLANPIPDAASSEQSTLAALPASDAGLGPNTGTFGLGGREGESASASPGQADADLAAANVEGNQAIANAEGQDRMAGLEPASSAASPGAAEPSTVNASEQFNSPAPAASENAGDALGQMAQTQRNEQTALDNATAASTNAFGDTNVVTTENINGEMAKTEADRQEGLNQLWASEAESQKTGAGSEVVASKEALDANADLRDDRYETSTDELANRHEEFTRKSEEGSLTLDEGRQWSDVRDQLDERGFPTRGPIEGYTDSKSDQSLEQEYGTTDVNGKYPAAGNDKGIEATPPSTEGFQSNPFTPDNKVESDGSVGAWDGRTSYTPSSNESASPVAPGGGPAVPAGDDEASAPAVAAPADPASSPAIMQSARDSAVGGQTDAPSAPFSDNATLQSDAVNAAMRDQGLSSAPAAVSEPSWASSVNPAVPEVTTSAPPADGWAPTVNPGPDRGGAAEPSAAPAVETAYNNPPMTEAELLAAPNRDPNVVAAAMPGVLPSNEGMAALPSPAPGQPGSEPPGTNVDNPPAELHNTPQFDPSSPDGLTKNPEFRDNPNVPSHEIFQHGVDPSDAAKPVAASYTAETSAPAAAEAQPASAGSEVAASAAAAREMVASGEYASMGAVDGRFDPAVTSPPTQEMSDIATRAAENQARAEGINPAQVDSPTAGSGPEAFADKAADIRQQIEEAKDVGASYDKSISDAKAQAEAAGKEALDAQVALSKMEAQNGDYSYDVAPKTDVALASAAQPMVTEGAVRAAEPSSAPMPTGPAEAVPEAGAQPAAEANRLESLGQAVAPVAEAARQSEVAQGQDAAAGLIAASQLPATQPNEFSVPGPDMEAARQAQAAEAARATEIAQGQDAVAGLLAVAQLPAPTPSEFSVPGPDMEGARQAQAAEAARAEAVRESVGPPLQPTSEEASVPQDPLTQAQRETEQQRADLTKLAQNVEDSKAALGEYAKIAQERAQLIGEQADLLSQRDQLDQLYEQKQQELAQAKAEAAQAGAELEATQREIDAMDRDMARGQDAAAGLIPASDLPAVSSEQPATAADPFANPVINNEGVVTSALPATSPAPDAASPAASASEMPVNEFSVPGPDVESAKAAADAEANKTGGSGDEAKAWEGYSNQAMQDIGKYLALDAPSTQDRGSFTVDNDGDTRGNTSRDTSHQGDTASGLPSNEVNGVVIDGRNPDGVRLGDYGVVTDNATGEQYPVVAYDTHPGRGNSVSEISNGLQNQLTGVDNSNRSVSGDYTVEMYPGSGRVFNDGQDVRNLSADQVNANLNRFFGAYRWGN